MQTTAALPGEVWLVKSVTKYTQNPLEKHMDTTH